MKRGFRELHSRENLINKAEFFDAHEALEDVWRAAPPENKKFLQGLIQVAVAFHHYSTGNRVGMRSVLERAIKNLSQPSGSFGEIQLAALLQSLGQWREALDNETCRFHRCRGSISLDKT